MKTTNYFRLTLALLLLSLSLSCGSRYKGSAADTTGTNGATNGTGKVPKSDSVHNYQTR